MNSKKRCKSCKDYFPAQEVVTTNLGNFCTSCFGCAEKRYPTKIANPNRKKRKKRAGKSDIPAAMKDAVRSRDGWRCRWCGNRSMLEVHHIIYRSEGGKHEEHNLITLCKEHHGKAHSNKGAWQKTLQFTNWCTLIGKSTTVTIAARRLVGLNAPNLEEALVQFWNEHDTPDLSPQAHSVDLSNETLGVANG